MPYPNEHSCRQEDPGKFEPDSFRRAARKIKGKPETARDGSGLETRPTAARGGAMVFLELMREGFRQEVDGAAWNLVVPEGEWQHPEYGKVQFSRQKLDNILSNFTDRVIQVDPAVDYDHEAATGSSTRAAGWIEELRYLATPTPGLWARVNWTPAAKQAIEDGEYRYLSPEWGDAWTDNQGRKFKDVLFGAALTNRPFLRTEMARHPVLAASEGMYLAGRTTKRHGTGTDADLEVRATNGMEDADMADQETTNTGTEQPSDGVKALAEVQAQLAAEKTAREAAGKELAELRLRLDREEIVKALSEPMLIGGRKHVMAPMHLARFVEIALGLNHQELRFFSDVTKIGTAGAPDRTQRAHLIAAVRDLGKALVELGERGFSGGPEIGGTPTDRILAAAAEKVKTAGANEQGKAKLTLAQAQAMVLAEQPELARQYQAEMTAKATGN